MAFWIKIRSIDQSPQNRAGRSDRRAKTQGSPWAWTPDELVSRVRRRNPRPRNVIASEAGLLARRSSHRFRPSRRDAHDFGRTPVARGGTAARRLQLRGQRRISSLRTAPASRLSPAAQTLLGYGTGNLDLRSRAQVPSAVNMDIKNSLYLTSRDSGAFAGLTTSQGCIRESLHFQAFTKDSCPRKGNRTRRGHRLNRRRCALSGHLIGRRLLRRSRLRRSDPTVRKRVHHPFDPQPGVKGFGEEGVASLFDRGLFERGRAAHGRSIIG